MSDVAEVDWAERANAAYRRAELALAPDPAPPEPVVLSEAGQLNNDLMRQYAFYAWTSRRGDLHPDKRAVAGAFVDTLTPRRIEFLRAAIAHPEVREKLEGGMSVRDLVLNTPARWEFEHIQTVGELGNAYSLAGRYRVAAGFKGVHPLSLDDRLVDSRCVPYYHKPTSPFKKRIDRRMELKRQLGSYGSLVSHAKKMPLSLFLAHWKVRKGETVTLSRKKMDPRTRKYYMEESTNAKTMKDLPTQKLLERTGYTPEMFWRECNQPGTVKPLFLVAKPKPAPAPPVVPAIVTKPKRQLTFDFAAVL